MESRLIGRPPPMSSLAPAHSGYTGPGEKCCLSVSATSLPALTIADV